MIWFINTIWLTSAEASIYQMSANKNSAEGSPQKMTYCTMWAEFSRSRLSLKPAYVRVLHDMHNVSWEFKTWCILTNYIIRSKNSSFLSILTYLLTSLWWAFCHNKVTKIAPKFSNWVELCQLCFMISQSIFSK